MLVAFPSLVEGWGCYKLVSEHGFNTEPGWAMLVVVEEKFLENNFCRNGQNSSLEPRFQTLSLNGMDKWSLDLRFQEKIVSG